MTQTRAAGSRLRPRVLLQIALTLLAFGYLVHSSDLNALGAAFRRAPVWSVPAAVFALLAVMFAGTLRWRLLLAAYGAQTALPMGLSFGLLIHVDGGGPTEYFSKSSIQGNA